MDFRFQIFVSDVWRLFIFYIFTFYFKFGKQKSRQSFQIIGRYFISEFQSPQFSLYEKNIVYRRSEFSSLFFLQK
ncbi:hypothetical protein C1637_17170 [Chryseobacterium lactis]|uniref:Uncharacterized protein n=1 Tax=Chryseobacterium lactis TaxID=1241981 RepID=A0A3G6RED8_CHRLC|nr:hypothetical protein EG342_14585 [Chryseobacterium lactis]AZB03412.1 hypothetical protein EG341_05450 [Chryseobacterium lactis]PNW12302.1 hypothetical protein C1637_17170 [Chryseobacterium lactis]